MARSLLRSKQPVDSSKRLGRLRSYPVRRVLQQAQDVRPDCLWFQLSERRDGVPDDLFIRQQIDEDIDRARVVAVTHALPYFLSATSATS